MPGLFLTEQGTPFDNTVDISGVYNVTEGSTVKYGISPANTSPGTYTFGQSGRKMYLTFEDIEGIAPDQTMSIIAATPDANCYLVQAGSTVRIPLRKLFWIWEKELKEELDPANMAILNPSPEIIWQTTNGLIQNATLNRNNSTDYRDCTLDVTTSGATPEGNAVVAILSNDGKIRWSFHIWVTDYNPDNGGPVFPMSPKHLFMDRNLGSNGNHTTLTPEGVGMYYQWGRKEPFPGPSVFDGEWEFDLTIDNNQRRVVNASNQQVLTKFENVNTLQNLGNSIHNPTVFYKADEWEVSVMQDWYTNSDSEMKYQNNYLWNDKKNRKAPYDPCPEGWRVPESSNVMLLNDLLRSGTVTPSSDGNVKWSYTHQQGQVWDIPFHGYIEDGLLRFATYFGDLWGRNVDKSIALEASFTPESPEVYQNANFRKIGSPVRCIKDTHIW